MFNAHPDRKPQIVEPKALKMQETECQPKLDGMKLLVQQTVGFALSVCRICNFLNWD